MTDYNCLNCGGSFDYDDLIRREGYLTTIEGGRDVHETRLCCPRCGWDDLVEVVDIRDDDYYEIRDDDYAG